MYYVKHNSREKESKTEVAHTSQRAWYGDANPHLNLKVKGKVLYTHHLI